MSLTPHSSPIGSLLRFSATLLLAVIIGDSPEPRAGEFINLTFDDAHVTPEDIASGGNTTGTMDRLLPGWQLFTSDTQPYTGLIQWGQPHEGMPFALFPSPYTPTGYALWIDTRLLPSVFSDPGYNIIHLRQTATIPIWATGFQTYGGLNLTINGQPPDISLGDDFLRPWAGKQVTLDFSNVDWTTGAIIPVTVANGPFDILNFYPVPIPEPSTWVLLASGLGALVWSRRRREAVVKGGTGHR